jgi:long-chain acyl-CoA synthetase
MLEIAMPQPAINASLSIPEPAIPPRLLTDLLDNALNLYPERVAIDFLGRTWTYAELGQLVRRAARGLQNQGLRKGDRFGLCLPNCPYFVILYFAALRVGAIVVNFNPLYTERELEHQIRDSGTRMMAVPDVQMIHEKVQAVAPRAGLDKIVLCGMRDMLPWLQGLGFALSSEKTTRGYSMRDFMSASRHFSPMMPNLTQSNVTLTMLRSFNIPEARPAFPKAQC